MLSPKKARTENGAAARDSLTSTSAPPQTQTSMKRTKELTDNAYVINIKGDENEDEAEDKSMVFSSQPLVARFSQCIPTNLDQLNFTLLQQKSREKRGQVKIIGSESTLAEIRKQTDGDDSSVDETTRSVQVEYRSQNYGSGSDVQMDRKFKYLVLKLDKNQHEAVLLNRAELNQYAFSFSQHLFQPNRRGEGNRKGAGRANEGEWSYLQSHQELIEKFGSVKAKKALKSRQQNTVSVSQRDGTHYLNKIYENSPLGKRTIDEQKKSGISEASNTPWNENSKFEFLLCFSQALFFIPFAIGLIKARRMMLPPFNINARKPRSIYPMSQLFTEDARAVFLTPVSFPWPLAPF